MSIFILGPPTLSVSSRSEPLFFHYINSAVYKLEKEIFRRVDVATFSFRADMSGSSLTILLAVMSGSSRESTPESAEDIDDYYYYYEEGEDGDDEEEGDDDDVFVEEEAPMQSPSCQRNSSSRDHEEENEEALMALWQKGLRSLEDLKASYAGLFSEYDVASSVKTQVHFFKKSTCTYVMQQLYTGC